MPDIGRNDPCPCKSGKKYKKCCEAKDQAKESATLNKQWEKAEKEFEKEKKESEAKEEVAGSSQTAPTSHKPATGGAPHIQKHNTMAAPKFNMPRKTGGG